MTGRASDQRSETELLAELGAELLGSGIGFGAQDPSRFRRFAEQWIERNQQAIRAALCDDPTVSRIFERDVEERLVDAATVADALAALAGRPAVSLLAVILLKRGRERVCGP